jgi:hypothetical protein
MKLLLSLAQPTKFQILVLMTGIKFVKLLGTMMLSRLIVTEVVGVEEHLVVEDR